MKLLIKDVDIVDAFQDFHGDVYIENGIIKEIGRGLNEEDAEVILGNGLTLMPSFIDTHAHFREPGLTHKEDIESGSKASVRGGYTGVCLMANTAPICSNYEVLNQVRNRAAEVGLIDVHQCVSVTDKFKGQTIEHLEAFKEDKKLKAISDDGVGVMDSKIMMDAMIKAKEHGWIVMSHAEDKAFSKTDMRMAEDIMTLRDLYLAKSTGAHLHMCHVSTRDAIKYIKQAKEEGINVTCEVTPHHLALTTKESNYRVNPPIREEEDVSCLINAIKTGIVDCIGTDHAPHTEEDKLNGAPGMVGIETAFSICYTKLVKENGISLNKLSEIMSKNPAKLLGMNKGIVSVGVEGDLVLIDRNKKIIVDKEKFKSKGRNTPFHGREYYGEVKYTIKAGKIVYQA